MWRYIEPYYYIETLDFCHHEHSYAEMEADEARLISMGPRAIDPIIEKLRGSGSFEWESVSLLGIMQKIGAPAHQRLLFLIDHGTNDFNRIGLINALQESFNDYSRLNLWLDFERCARNPDTRELQKSLSFHFSNVPIITDDKEQILYDFVVWYKKTHALSGRLPPYNFDRLPTCEF